MTTQEAEGLLEVIFNRYVQRMPTTTACGLLELALRDLLGEVTTRKHLDAVRFLEREGYVYTNLVGSDHVDWYPALDVTVNFGQPPFMVDESTWKTCGDGWVEFDGENSGGTWPEGGSVDNSKVIKGE